MKFGPHILLALITLQSCLILDGSFHDKSIETVSLSTTDNQGLRKDRQATIDRSSGLVRIDVPDYVDATNLVPTIDYRGLSLEIEGAIWESGSTVDLSRTRTLTVRGMDDKTRDYTLEVTRVPPDSTKAVVWLIGLSWASPDSSYTGYSRLYFQEESLGRWYADTRYYYRTDFYLEVATTGTEVWVGGQRLAQGYRSDGVYSANNWLPLQNTTLTIVAEDLSTRDIDLVFGKNE